MSSDFLYAFRHNAWANQQILESCRALTEEQANTSLPGGYGHPLATLKHIAGAEAYYRSLFSGSLPQWDWRDDAIQSLDEIAPWFADMAAFWEELLAGPFDGERMLATRRSQLKSGVLLTQALHHGNVHREQISAVLTSLGLTPPDVSAWAYGDASGQIIR